LTELLILGLFLCSFLRAQDALLVAELKATGKPPGEYVVSKFAKADVVLLGEDHAIKQNLAFVRSLIPLLYKAGVGNLVMEFGAEEDQAKLDALITAPAFDEAAAKQLMFHYNTMWSWQDYRELYRAAWEFNRQLAPGSKPFRILNMSYVFDWSEFSGVRTPAAMHKVFPRGAIDEFRARLIEREILDRHQKALVLTGTPHALTRFAKGEPNPEADGFCVHTRNMLGNRLQRDYPDRVTNIMFHQLLGNLPQQSPIWIEPAHREIEKLTSSNGNAPVGFDLRNTRIGTLKLGSAYSVCDPELTLGEFFDGYIFLAPISQLTAATPDETFVNETNLRVALEQFPDPDWSKKPTDLGGVRRHIRDMADSINRKYQTGN
jgi:hypothetical protein